MDGYYKDDGTPDGEKEKVGRFSLLYTRRVEWLSTKQWGLNPGPSPSDGIVIYGWRDEDKPGQTPGSGKWHIIRVQANLPTLCGDQCARTQCEYGTGESSCAEPYMPSILQYKKGGKQWYSVSDYAKKYVNEYGTQVSACKGHCGNHNGSSDFCGSGSANKLSYRDVRKCFKGGLVRADLIRYDEGGGALNWATGVNFWNMIFKNPNASQTSFSPDDIEAVCDLNHANQSTPDGGQSSGLEGAFVLNRPSSENVQCWNLANNLLQQGIEAQSCAEYFVRHGGFPHSYDHSKFGIKFVKCPPPSERSWPGVSLGLLPPGVTCESLSWEQCYDVPNQCWDVAASWPYGLPDNWYGCFSQQVTEPCLSSCVPGQALCTATCP